MLDSVGVEDALDQILDLIPQIRKLHAELRETYRETRVSGFPRDTSIRPSVHGDVADPTFEAAAERIDGKDPVKDALRGFLAALQGGRRLLESTVAQGMKAFPPPPAPDEPDPDWCRSCLRADVFEPIYPKAVKAELCRWCYEYQLERDGLPVEALILFRASGRRITSKVLKAMEA